MASFNKRMMNPYLRLVACLALGTVAAASLTSCNPPEPNPIVKTDEIKADFVLANINTNTLKQQLEAGKKVTYDAKLDVALSSQAVANKLNEITALVLQYGAVTRASTGGSLTINLNGHVIYPTDTGITVSSDTGDMFGETITTGPNGEEVVIVNGNTFTINSTADIESMYDAIMASTDNATIVVGQGFTAGQSTVDMLNDFAGKQNITFSANGNYITPATQNITSENDKLHMVLQSGGMTPTDYRFRDKTLTDQEINNLKGTWNTNYAALRGDGKINPDTIGLTDYFSDGSLLDSYIANDVYYVDAQNGATVINWSLNQINNEFGAKFLPTANTGSVIPLARFNFDKTVENDGDGTIPRDGNGIPLPTDKLPRINGDLTDLGLYNLAAATTNVEQAFAAGKVVYILHGEEHNDGAACSIGDSGASWLGYTEKVLPAVIDSNSFDDFPSIICLDLDVIQWYQYSITPIIYMDRFYIKIASGTTATAFYTQYRALEAKIGSKRWVSKRTDTPYGANSIAYSTSTFTGNAYRYVPPINDGR